MKVTLLTYGSQGDVEPFIGLAELLIQAGHQVKIAAPQIFSESVTDHRIEFIDLPGDPRMMFDQLVNQAGKNPHKMVTSITKFVLPLALY